MDTIDTTVETHEMIPADAFIVLMEEAGMLDSDNYALEVDGVFRGAFGTYADATAALRKLMAGRRLLSAKIHVRAPNAETLSWITPFEPYGTTEVLSRCRVCDDLVATTKAWDRRCLACAEEFHEFDPAVDTESQGADETQVFWWK